MSSDKTGNEKLNFDTQSTHTQTQKHIHKLSGNNKNWNFKYHSNNYQNGYPVQKSKGDSMITFVIINNTVNKSISITVALNARFREEIIFNNNRQDI